MDEDLKNRLRLSKICAKNNRRILFDETARLTHQNRKVLFNKIRQLCLQNDTYKHNKMMNDLGITYENYEDALFGKTNIYSQYTISNELKLLLYITE